MMWYKLPSLKNCDPKSLSLLVGWLIMASPLPIFQWKGPGGELRLVVNLKLLRGQYRFQRPR